MNKTAAKKKKKLNPKAKPKKSPARPQEDLIVKTNYRVGKSLHLSLTQYASKTGLSFNEAVVTLLYQAMQKRP